MIKLKLRGDAPAMTWTNAEVEALKAERDKLRAALEEIAEKFDISTPGEIAHRALEETK
jgi:hypothetical protein